MRDSLRTFCLRHLYQNPAASSKELIELAAQQGYLEPSAQDSQAKLLRVLAGIPREERMGNDRFFPGGLAEFRNYDSLVTVLAQSRTLDITLLRPLVGAVNLALHQDRRFYCLEDGSWYLQHQTIVNDELLTALQKEHTRVSLRAWLEKFIAEHPGTAPIFWSLDPRFVLEGDQIRLHAQCMLLGQVIEQQWPVWESLFAQGARVTTESLLQLLPQQGECRPSPVELEHVLALKGVYPIGHDRWMLETFIPEVPAVGGAVAFRVSDSLQEEPLAFPSLLVLDSLGIGEVVITAAHLIYGVLPISWNKTERLYIARGLGLGLGLDPEDNTFEVWHKDGFLFSEALAQRLLLLGSGQCLRLSITEDGLFFELRGFDARIAKTQRGLFSREELLLPASALHASFLQQLQTEPEGINLSTLIAGLRPDYTLSEIAQALTSPRIERGSGGFCLYRPLSFEPQEALHSLLVPSTEIYTEQQPQALSEQKTFPSEEVHSFMDDSLLALFDKSDKSEPQSPEPQDLPALTDLRTEASLDNILATQGLAPEAMTIPTEATSVATPPPLFAPLSLEELFSAESEAENSEQAQLSEPGPSLQHVPVLELEEEGEEEGTERIDSLDSLQATPEMLITDVPPTDSVLLEEFEDLEEKSVKTLPTTQEGYLELIRTWKQEGSIPVEQAESLTEEEPLVLEHPETQPIPTEIPAVLEAEETVEVAQIASEFMDSEEIAGNLPEEQEDPVQPSVPSELMSKEEKEPILQPLVTEVSYGVSEPSQEIAPEPEAIPSFLLLDDLAISLTGEKRVETAAPAVEVEVEVPILLEIHPLPLDLAPEPVISEAGDETLQIEAGPIEQSLLLEEIIQDLNGEDFSLPIESAEVQSAEPTTEEKEPLIEIQPVAVAPNLSAEAIHLNSETDELLNIEELAMVLTGEKPVVSVETITEFEEPITPEAQPITVEEPLAEIQVQEPIQMVSAPIETQIPLLWIDELRMDLTKGEAPLQMPTEIASGATTASPEAIAFLHTLFEEAQEEPVIEQEEEKISCPPASLQAKLKRLADQREAILAYRES
jgi:hypothetical protein